MGLMKQPLSDILAESLSVYARTIKETWPALAAVLIPANAFIVWIHSQIAVRFGTEGGIPIRAIKIEQTIERVLTAFTILATAIAVRAAWKALEKPTDEAGLFGRTPTAWGRAFCTWMLIGFLSLAYCVVFALVGGLAGAPIVSMAIRGLPQGVQIAISFSLLSLFLSAFVAVGVAIFAKWLLATEMSMLFNLAGNKAMEASSHVLKGRVANCIAFLILAGLVKCALSVVPGLAGLCDVVGFLHPFTEFGAAGRLAAGLLMTCTGAICDMLAIFTSVALVVYLRRTCEAPAEPANAKFRILVRTLAAVGALVFVSVLAFAAAKGAKEPRDLYALRVFRMENTEEPNGIEPITDFCFVTGIGEIRVEKPNPLDILSRNRVVWVEVPFCSHCGMAYRPDSGGKCTSHDCDTYAWKLCLVEGATASYPVHSFKLGPRDAQRPTTPEERERIRNSNTKLP